MDILGQDKVTYRHRLCEEPQPRTDALAWWTLGLGVLCLFAGRAIHCSESDFQQCMRDGMPGMLGVLLQAGVLVLAVWAGSELGRRQRSTWIGLACGAVLFSALSGLLAWLDLSPAP